MPQDLILASASEIRQTLLRNAGVKFTAEAARVDESAVRDALIADAASPRDIADTLAELKAMKVSGKNPGALVIGCDQVLSFNGELFSKPTSPRQACDQLSAMRGKRHDLLSAVVICTGGKPVWRHVGVVHMTMNNFSDTYLESYINRNWDSIRHSAGAYKLEEEGVRLFSSIDGNYFNVLGLPLLNLLTYLDTVGVLEE